MEYAKKKVKEEIMKKEQLKKANDIVKKMSDNEIMQTNVNRFQSFRVDSWTPPDINNFINIMKLIRSSSKTKICEILREDLRIENYTLNKMFEEL